MEFKDKIEKATVTLTKLNGRGVLVRGNFILTAAHCLEYYGAGLTLGDHHREPIKTADGKELMVGPLAIEPVHDIAVLGALDDQEFSRECANFEKFCKKTEPIEICTRSFKAFKKYPVFVYTHEGKWITGHAHSYQEHSHSLWLEMNEAIKAGTSGSPILDKWGCVIGLVSNFIGENSISSVTGRAWRPHLSLPVWVCNQISGKK